MQNWEFPRMKRQSKIKKVIIGNLICEGNRYDEWFELYRINIFIFHHFKQVPFNIHFLSLVDTLGLFYSCLFMFINKNTIPVVIKTHFVIKMSWLHSKPSLLLYTQRNALSLTINIEDMIYDQYTTIRRRVRFFSPFLFFTPFCISTFCFFIHQGKNKVNGG